MTALKVLAVILLVLFLVGLIRVGGGGEYSAQGLTVWIKLGPFRIKVFPLKKEKTKKKKEKTPAKAKKALPETEKPAEEKPKKGGALTQVKAFLPLICEAAGALKRRIRIDKLYLDYTLAGKEDAAAAAMSFGYSNAAVGMILALFEQNFDVKERRVRTAVDFNADSPKIYVCAVISARLGQLVSFALRFGWKFLMVYQKTKNPKKEAI